MTKRYVQKREDKRPDPEYDGYGDGRDLGATENEVIESLQEDVEDLTRECRTLRYQLPEWRPIETAPYCLVIVSKDGVVGMAFRTFMGWYWERDKLDLMDRPPDRWMPLPAAFVRAHSAGPDDAKV